MSRLPFEGRRGEVGASVRELWGVADGFVLVCAVGIAVRVVGPLLGSKHDDPAVVCVDDAGRWTIPLVGGHRGANELAREVASLLGAEAVVTTATDSRPDVPALDTLPGFHAGGDLAGVTRAWLDGEPPLLDQRDLPGWPLPPALAGLTPLDASSDASSDGSPAQAGHDARLRSPGDPPPRPPGPPSPPPSPEASPRPPARRGLVRVTDRLPDDEPDRAGAGPRTATPLTDQEADRPTDGVMGAPRAGGPGVVVLRPGSLVVGVGSSSGADPGGIAELVEGALRDAGLAPQSVDLVASVDLKRDEAGIVALASRHGVELRTFPAEVLAGIAVPNPSPVVDAAVGTPSVAEAAALAAAGPGAELVVAKRHSAEATVAVARRPRPEGLLAVVGLGPGDPAWRTPAAAAAVRHAEVVVGYGPYVDQAADLLADHHEVVRSPIGAEVDRCREALDRARRGQRVALVCSGDAGVFALATLVCELAPAHGDPAVTVVPGVTAATAAAAVLGAPLGHDHAAVSLSDLLTPWAVIERRLEAVAGGDLAVSLYNPRSQRRTWQLARAAEILATARPRSCPVAVVTDVGRPGQSIVRTTLGDFGPGAPAFDGVGMLSLVVVGASSTRWIGDRMVTPRGYATPAPAPPTEATAAASPPGRERP